MNLKAWKLKYFFGLWILILLFPIQTHAQETEEEFFKGEIVSVGEMKTEERGGYQQGMRLLIVKIEDTSGEIKEVTVEEVINLETKINQSDLLEKGDEVVVGSFENGAEVKYTIFEPYRLNAVVGILFIFFFLVVLITGKKGAWALLGLVLTFLILIEGLIPQVIEGSNPVLMCFGASVLIATITFYMAHGFKKRTTLALVSTLGTLVIAFIVSILAVEWAQLLGTGSEDATSLSFAGLNPINLKGLLLGAIVIGTLGVLDDVTVTQISTVKEIHKANSSLSYKELYKRGLSVGKDHIASIINTLVLAYAGASFPALILLVSSPWPLWMTLNNEFMAEEIVRTLVGSMTLILAVPISTMFGAYFYSKKEGYFKDLDV